MLLAIGDVVRVRNDQALGTVTGVASHSHGNLVCLEVARNEIRAVQPHELELVARGCTQQSAGQDLSILLFVFVGLVAAVVTGFAVFNEGGDILLTLFVAFTSLTTVTSGLINLFHRPRRIRV
ncbi:hypothetical protein [Streptomyces cucumeris]|uniref:hypothetical protein n=1 Tax=Streptomyces cucumeris TaxID=2962890 RepID=UPI0020C8DB55|nr:hypothetical protein [Streptomyces sp. NEAU-Y11]MCP9207109.1 hypothetical protein [Streptomyces sp. NEAU-Y11]